MSRQFNRDYLVSLPLPVAQLYSRAHNAGDARGRHDSAFYLFESLIKLSALAPICCYLSHRRSGGVRLSKLDDLLSNLSRPSLGHWIGLLRETTRYCHEAKVAAGTAPTRLGHLWEQLDCKHDDLSGLLKLYQRIKHGPDGQVSGDQRCSIFQVFDALVQYRNAVFGHGANRQTNFYRQDMEPLLFEAANDVLLPGVLDFLGPPESKLLVIESIHAIDLDAVEISLRELHGIQSQRVEPISVDRNEAAHLAPGIVVLMRPNDPEPFVLDPFLVYRKRGQSEELLFLNRKRSEQEVEYLSYSSGQIEKDKTKAQSLNRILNELRDEHTNTIESKQANVALIEKTVTLQAKDRVGLAVSARRRIGQYLLHEQIGVGGMGVVYKAEHVNLKRMVAIKVLPETKILSHQAVERFYREMEAIGKLDHPNIVRATDAGEFDGVHCLVMELVDGVDLSNVVRARGALEAADACEIIRQAAVGLQYIYDHGLVHRDIKPSNLLLTCDGKVKILDLGLARLGRGPESERQLTTSGIGMGTLDYMAPEQLANARDVDIRADIYSLGCTLYHLLSGGPPFAGEAYRDAVEKMVAHAQDPPPPFASTLPDALFAIVKRMMAKDPVNRFQTPAEVAEVLAQYCRGAATRHLVETETLKENFQHNEDASETVSKRRLKTEPVGDKRLRLMDRMKNGVSVQLVGVAVLLVGVFGVYELVMWSDVLFASRTERDEQNENGNEQPKTLVGDLGVVECWKWDDSKTQNTIAISDDGKLRIETGEESIILLGEIADRNYNFSIDFFQHDWDVIGIVFGFAGEHFETIEYHDLFSKKKLLRTSRHFAIIAGIPQEKLTTTVNETAGIELTRLEFDRSPVRTFELVVRDGKVVQLGFDGNRYPELTVVPDELKDKVPVRMPAPCKIGVVLSQPAVFSNMCVNGEQVRFQHGIKD
jgi:serine/threonine protein kinase